MKKILIYIAGLCSLCACSVKESRINCPCYLTVIRGVGGVAGYEDGKVVVFAADREGMQRHESVYGEFRTLPEEFVVRRGAVNAGVHTCGDKVSDGRYTYTDDNQMDSLYAGRVGLVCELEEATAEVSMHKQFATVTVRVVGKDTSKPYPFTLVMHGNSAGYDIVKGEPMKGNWSFSCNPDYGRPSVFRIGRQCDGRILLSVNRPDGSEYAVMDVGEELSRNGYDWHSADLEDVTLTVDAESLRMGIGLDPWDNGDAEF